MARFSLVILALVSSAWASLGGSSHGIRHEVHDKIGRSGDLTERSDQRDWKLKKRFDNARFTYFETGLGACGATNTKEDSIVALNVEQFGNGEHCFEDIIITYNGKSKTAQVADRCSECPTHAVDLTKGLFQYFAPEGDGTFYGSWVFASDAAASSTSSTHTPTSTHRSKSSSSISTWSSTSTTSSSSTSFSSSTTSTSASSTSTSTAASASASVDSSSLIDVLDYAVVQLGGLVAGAAQANLQTSESS